jgi:hypothetical protein
MTANGPLVQFAGSTIRFDTAHPGLLTAINTHFQYCLTDRGEVIAAYQIASASDAGLSIAREGEVSPRTFDFEAALRHLMQDGLTQLNGASKTHLIFHAAALADADRGVILCGKSGCGKSTLAAGMVAGGFQYLTDEVIALPNEGIGNISGFCRSLVLKQGSDFIWQRLGLDPAAAGFLLFKDGGAWIAPALLNPSAPRSQVSPRLLLFVRYAPGAPLNAEPLTSARALFRLLQSLVNSRNFPDGGMAAAARLARQVPAFALTYSSIDSAGEWIQQQIQTN